MEVRNAEGTSGWTAIESNGGTEPTAGPWGREQTVILAAGKPGNFFRSWVPLALEKQGLEPARQEDQRRVVSGAATEHKAGDKR